MKRKLPAYPIFIKDPNFSFWSCADELNASDLQLWYGQEKRIYGFIKTENETYCFMGNTETFERFGVKKAEQTDLEVDAFSTAYTFQAGRATLKLRFVSPLPPDDYELLSMPVCYMEYEVSGVEKAEVSLFAYKNIAYDDVRQNDNKWVRGAVFTRDGFETALLGLRRQTVLAVTADNCYPDSGYFYLSGEKAYFLDDKTLAIYLATNSPIEKEWMKLSEERYIGCVNEKPQGVVTLGYDDIVSINYFGEYKRGWYLEKHTVVEAQEYVHAHYKEIDEKLAAFDRELREKSARFGDGYYQILIASLRQCMGAHKLVRDEDGSPLFLSKECNSNGSIATVDISYPSMPLFLLYAPELLKGMLKPVVRTARMPVWRFDFAPHDAGRYPFCTGQVGGFNGGHSHNRGRIAACDGWYRETGFPTYLLPENFDEDCWLLEKQMPVEECANMLIMTYACYRCDGSTAFYTANADLMKKWVCYLVKYGLKPEEQLCTDDFAGRLANNVNLAIKATIGIACYSRLLAAVGDDEQADEYRKTAENYAAELEEFGKRYECMPLSWDKGDETYSLKYNMAIDKIFDLGLFGKETYERETDRYLKERKQFGTPLDSRDVFTKSDWLIWAAALTDSDEKRKELIAPLNTYLETSPDRVPFGDLYITTNGKHIGFTARSVQGGCFLLLLL